MKIAFDATTVAFEKKTGTGVYCEELIKAFEKRFPEDHFFHTYRLTRAMKGAKYFLPLGPHAKRQIFQDPWTVFRGFQYDIFHGLNARLPFLKGAIKVVTIQDLFSIYGHFSEEKFKKVQKAHILKTLSRAHHVITSATYTKRQLVEKMGFDENKISVVGLGVRAEYLQPFELAKEKKSVREKFNIKKPFFLFVGTLEKRKNIEGVLTAFHKFKVKDPSHQLVLIGQPGFGYDSIQKKILELNLSEDVVQLSFMEESDLASFYRSCAGLLFLSWEEGYGIPVIEAMACGAPVISSHTTSLPEVGNGFSFLVSPEKPDEAVLWMEKLVKPENSLKDEITRGQKYARTLTWEKVAVENKKVYEKILHSLS